MTTQKNLTDLQPESLFQNESAFYRELTSRNFHFVTAETQKKLSEIDVLVAGCGSTGGACTASLARVGVKNFRLADNGDYELTNLNRQHARLDSIGKNKAVFHSEEIRSIQPFAKTTVYADGLTPENLEAAVAGAHLVIDAVDVTSPSGMDMKIRLHDECARRRLPVFTALDLGYRQWGMSFDYRANSLLPFRGLSAAARAKKHPISALFTLYPLAALPDHALTLVEDLLENRVSYASQLGATSDLLSSIIVASTIRFVESGEIVPGWSIDLWNLKESRKAGILNQVKSKLRFRALRKRIKAGILNDRYTLK